MKKYVILGVYFGKFPEWYDFWEQSAVKNVNIDYIIFTNNIRKNKSNVFYYNFTLKEFNLLASQKLGMKIEIQNYYKLCDFKIVYGKIFGDYIMNYNYWGHCDFDLIFGDIFHFINKFNINEYDKFLPLGHLSFYRNCESVNNYYLNYDNYPKSYKNIFTSNNFFAFDEIGMIEVYEKGDFPFFKERIFAEINQRYKRFKLNKKDKNYKHQLFYYEDGKIFMAYLENHEIKINEFMYLHFQNRKFNEIGKVGRYFYITYNGFIPKEKGIPNIETIKALNKYKGLWYEKCEIVKFNFSSKFRKIGHFILINLHIRKE